MVTRASTVLSMVVLSVLLCQPAAAEKGGVSLGVNAGTLGIGDDITIGLAPKANIRSKANGFKYKYDSTQDGIAYKFDLGLLSALSVLDLHPTEGGFRLSGGLMLNKNKIDADAHPSSSYTIGSTTYTPAEVGTMTGKLDFKTIAPYVGLGWGNGVGEDKTLRFAPTPESPSRAHPMPHWSQPVESSRPMRTSSPTSIGKSGTSKMTPSASSTSP